MQKTMCPNWTHRFRCSIEGERGEENLLDAATVHLQPNTVFGTYLALSCDQAKKEEVIQLDNLSVVLQDKSILQNLLRWESLYNGYVIMSKKYGDSDSEQTLNALNELRENLELIEMELQGNTEKLIW